jgi:hypothetical protein
MGERRVGRVLVASLHQSIADILPTRLGFYESWLNAEGLREGTIGLAPLYAVLSFLRQEGEEAYAAVTSTAGEYAAEWTVGSMRPATRSLIERLPPLVRRRVVLGRAGALVRMSYDGTRASCTMRKGTARVSLSASVFCVVREPVGQPLCGYYTAAMTRMLSMFGLPAVVTVESCRGSGGKACIYRVPFAIATEPEPAGVA